MWQAGTAAPRLRTRVLRICGVLVCGEFAGCGGGVTTGPPPPSADFTLALTPSSVTLSQGTTNSGVQVSVRPLNGFSGVVQITLNGLPSGVISNLTSPFEVQSGASVTLLLGASASATTGSVSVAALGTSGSLMHSANLALTVLKAATAAVSRTTFLETDSVAALDDPPGEPHHRHLVYDAANHHLFVANRAANRVEVFSTRDGSRVATVDVAGASSADLSADGKTVWIGTLTNKIVTIDSTALRGTGAVPIAGLVPIPNLLFDRPEEVMALSRGKLLVRLRQASGSESLLALLDPATSLLTNLTPAAPQVFVNGVGVVARSRDGTRVFVGSNDSSGEAAIFDGNGKVAAGPIIVGAGTISCAAGNQDGSRFSAVLESAGSETVLLLDSSLHLITIRATSKARGVVFSSDGATVYVAETQGANAVVTALAAADLHSLGQVEDLNVQSVASEIEDSDETALLFGLNNRGISFVDAATPRAISAPLPQAAGVPAVSPASGPNTGGTVVSISGSNFASSPTVNFASQSAASVSASSGTLIQTTTSPSASSGAVNVTAYFPDGSLALAPLAFSYGPQVLEVLPNAGNKAGGDTVAIYGYGFGDDASKISVMFGPSAAAVEKVEDLSALAASQGLSATYPFPLQRVSVTSPMGGPDRVDIALSAPSGSTLFRSGFQYLQSWLLFAKAGWYKFLTYDRMRQWVYLSTIDHVDVYDLTAGAFRPGILPPGGPPPNALIRQTALTPDGSELLVTDLGAQSVYVMNPDAATGSAVQVGGIEGVTDSGPARICTTSNNTAFVGLADYAGSSAGCTTCLQQMDLAASPVSVGPAPQPQASILTSAPLMDASADGQAAFFAFAAAPGEPMAAWNAATPERLATAVTSASAVDLVEAADGTSFATLAGGVIEIRDPNFVLRSVTNTAELEGIPQRTYVPGIALHPSGALVYVPFLTGPPPANPPFAGLQGGVDILDSHSGRLRLRVMLPEPLDMLSAEGDGMHGKFLTIDENGQRLFALTVSGLTVVQLASVPLGFGTISPAAGPASGGSTATIRGSGFQSGTTVVIGGKATSVSFVDMNTLKVTLPTLSAGPQRITITNPDGEIVSVDAAYVAN